MHDAKLEAQKFKLKNPKNVNWFSLRKLNYQHKEEEDISSIIGVEYENLPFKGKEGLGGGGGIKKRNEVGLNRLKASKSYKDAHSFLNNESASVDMKTIDK